MSLRSSGMSKTRRIALGVVFACAFIALVGVSVWQLTLQANGGQTNSSAAEQTKTADSSSSADAGSDSNKDADSLTSDGKDSDSQADGAKTEDSQSAASGEDSNTGAASQESQASGASGSGSANRGSSSGGNSTPPTEQEPPPPATITVSFSIDCVNAVNYGNETAQSLSSSGYLLSTQLTLNPGATVYDALKASGAPINATSSAMGTYVSAIYSLQEKICGPTSGWLYLVNGSKPSASCSSYSLNDGDVVQWRYSVNPGDI